MTITCPDPPPTTVLPLTEPSAGYLAVVAAGLREALPPGQQPGALLRADTVPIRTSWVGGVSDVETGTDLVRHGPQATNLAAATSS